MIGSVEHIFYSMANESTVFKYSKNLSIIKFERNWHIYDINNITVIPLKNIEKRYPGEGLLRTRISSSKFRSVYEPL